MGSVANHGRMGTSRITGLILGLVVRSFAVNVENPKNPDHPKTRASWGYGPTNGPATWPANYATCAGSMQSPIDLTNPACVDPGPITMIGYDLPMSGKLTNNEHTLVFEFDGGVAPYIMGGRLPPGDRFEFLQLHWHWGSVSTQGSEHTLNGREFPMEIHLVHWNTRYGSVPNAVQYSDGLAVLGFFYEVSPTDNPNLRDIGSLVHKFRNKQLRMIKREKKQNKEKKEKGKLLSSLPVAGGATVSLPAMITLMQLIPANPGDYYYYQGGLTTPTCDEVVLWTNYVATIPISEAQLNKLRVLKDSSGTTLNDNYRPPQPLNARTLYMSKAVVPGVDMPAARTGGVDIVGAGIMAAVITGIASLLLPQEAPSARQSFNEAEERLRQAQLQFDY